MTKKILIVEDQEEILELLSAILGDFGDYTILCARDCVVNIAHILEGV